MENVFNSVANFTDLSSYSHPYSSQTKNWKMSSSLTEHMEILLSSKMKYYFSNTKTQNNNKSISKKKIRIEREIGRKVSQTILSTILYPIKVYL